MSGPAERRRPLSDGRHAASPLLINVDEVFIALNKSLYKIQTPQNGKSDPTVLVSTTHALYHIWINKKNKTKKTENCPPTAKLVRESG